MLPCLSVSTSRYSCDIREAFNGTVGGSERRPQTFNAWDTGCLERPPNYLCKRISFSSSRIDPV
ncbi:unnamed protein product [Pylaiella littoralis]